MKTIMNLVVVLFFPAIIIFSGCEKKEEYTPPIEEPIPELKAWASPEVVDFGGSTVVNYTSKDVDSVTLNQTRLPSLSGKINFVSLKRDTVLNFVGYYTSATGGTKTTDEVKTKVETVKITVQPEVVFDPPKIFLVYSTDTVQYDSSFYVEWTTENATSLWMNDTEVPVNGHFMFSRLKEDSVIYFKAFGSGGTTTDSVNVFVADAPPPPPTNENLEIIVLHSWRMVQYLGKDKEEDVWVELPLLIPDDKNLFFIDLHYEIYRNETLLSNGSFSINDSILHWPTPYFVRKLDKDTLKIEHKIRSGGQYDSVFRQEVYSYFL